MTVSAISGPFVAFGQAAQQSGLGQAGDYNPHAGPSSFYQGTAILDPRVPFTYQPGGKSTGYYGWLGTQDCPVLDITPATKAVAAIAAAANVVASTPMTLVAASGAGIVISQSVVNAATGQTVTGLRAIGQAMGSVAFGQSGGLQIWDPTTATARAVGITAAAGASGTVVFTVRGYDIYGYPMSEAITAAANTQTLGKKAFKYIASVTPSATDAQNYSVDTTDIFGFGLRADTFGYTQIFFNAIGIAAASTGFVGADATSPATTTTGDVRGTYAVQSASDGTKRLTVFIRPSVANVGTTAGLVGVTQV